MFARASRATGPAAGRAGSPEFKAVPHNCVTALIRKIVVERFNRAHIDIVYPAAPYTTNVIVQVGGAVKSFLTASNLYFLHYSLLAKPFQVAIYGCKAHPWKAGANFVKKFISRGMGFDGPQFFQDNFTLIGDTKFIYHDSSY